MISIFTTLKLFFLIFVKILLFFQNIIIFLYGRFLKIDSRVRVESGNVL